MNEILTLLLLLFFSGLFSGSETALTALSLARAEGLRKEGRTGARALYELKQDPSRMLITILIGNNVVNIAASAMATVVATRWFGSMGPGIAVGVLTILILIFGEITPKSMATRYSERISLFIAPWMLGFMRLIYPLVWLFSQFTSWVQKRSGRAADPTVTESELMSMIEYGEEEGAIDSEERELIERVFSFNDLKVEDVMTPRRQIFALSGRRTVGDALSDISHNSYSRIPLYSEDPSEIVSIVSLRDILEAIVEGQLERTLHAIARKPLFVPRNLPTDEMTGLLQRKKQHMAIVVDEHGSMQGIVTLEDLLEELVGEIYDESDILPEEVMELPGRKIVVEGATELRVVEEYFDADIPGKPTDTVSLWILQHTERIPRADERFTIDGFEVVVQSASSHRIIEVIIGRVGEAVAESPESTGAPAPGSA